MSRLVINKNSDRTLCVIKNFITIELENNFIRITDRYGVREFNIFNIELSYYSMVLGNCYITNSNAYMIQKYGDRCTWSVHYSIWNSIREAIQLHIFGEIVYAVKNKVIDIDGLIVTYENDNFSFTSGMFKVCDKFHIAKNSILLTDYRQIHLFGENSLIVLINNSETISVNIEILKKNNTYYPNTISYIYLTQPAFHTLTHFIAACLNILKTENEYLLGSLLS